MSALSMLIMGKYTWSLLHLQLHLCVSTWALGHAGGSGAPASICIARHAGELVME